MKHPRALSLCATTRDPRGQVGPEGPTRHQGHASHGLIHREHAASTNLDTTPSEVPGPHSQNCRHHAPPSIGTGRANRVDPSAGAGADSARRARRTRACVPARHPSHQADSSETGSQGARDAGTR